MPNKLFRPLLAQKWQLKSFTNQKLCFSFTTISLCTSFPCALLHSFTPNSILVEITPSSILLLENDIFRASSGYMLPNIYFSFQCVYLLFHCGYMISYICLLFIMLFQVRGGWMISYICLLSLYAFIYMLILPTSSSKYSVVV